MTIRKRIPVILIVAIATACLSGCHRLEMRKMLRKMMGSTVVLPENITCYNNGIWSELNDSIRDTPKFVFYIDSTDCSTCVLSHIGQYYHVFTYADSTKAFIPFVLLSIGEKHYDEITHCIILTEPSYPIYIDTENLFKPLNPFIPDDDRFHSFLINERGSPILVGLPKADTRGVEILNKAINKLNNTK